MPEHFIIRLFVYRIYDYEIYFLLFLLLCCKLSRLFMHAAFLPLSYDNYSSPGRDGKAWPPRLNQCCVIVVKPVPL